MRRFVVLRILAASVALIVWPLIAIGIALAYRCAANVLTDALRRHDPKPAPAEPSGRRKLTVTHDDSDVPRIITVTRADGFEVLRARDATLTVHGEEGR